MGKAGKPPVEKFFEKMEDLLGSDEIHPFRRSIEKGSAKSVRYIRERYLKTDLAGEEVTWCRPYGRYWVSPISPGQTLEYGIGCYYIQEASAMLAVAMAEKVMPLSGKVVLDMTASPGGKAIQTAELIGSGYLVANEVLPKRLPALVWNINRFQLSNILVTSLPGRELVKRLPGFFDVVLVDAPCSGEGLLAKGKASLDTWSERLVAFNARRQRSILNDAARLVKPGGAIVYSTCTFSREENEMQVAHLLGKGFEPVPLPGVPRLSPALSDNVDVCRCSRRIFPHREGGAGAFVAILQQGRKYAPGEPIRFRDPGLRELSLPGVLRMIMDDSSGFLFEKGGVISRFSANRIPVELWDAIRQLGAPLLDRRRGGKLMHGLAGFLPEERVADLEEEEILSYIAGRDLKMPLGPGPAAVAFRGLAAGLIEVEGGLGLNRLPGPLVNPLVKRRQI